MIGKTLSHYRIVAVLGSGGMGVVYRAHDEILERDVALKVLPEGALADEAARRQFRKEALALSKLNHPHIETIHELGSEDRLDFLVMELVPGRTLSDRIEEGPLPEEEVARLGEHLAEGLAAAHREGILHRDIKPGNIRVTPEGRLKILDFGLAKLTRVSESAATVTQTQSAAGTLPYMAPEQLRGGPIDNRCDVYAAGAVLYEMACGRRAFPQEAAPAVVGAILGQPPTSPREIFPGVSADLERIILRCLDKDPAHRYGSAGGLAEDLRQLTLPVDRRRYRHPRLRKRRRMNLVAAGGALALFLAAGLSIALNVGGLRDRWSGSTTTQRQALAVLPMANLSGDPEQEYFADGMTDELITRLSQVGALRVISRSSVMQYKGAKKPLRDIAKELNVGLLLEGAASHSGGRIRVSATLVDPFKGQSLWAESYQRSLTDALVLQSELARAIVERIQVQLTPQERARVARAAPVNPDAHRAYLKGRFHVSQFSRESLHRAREEFEHAIAMDPTFAPAYAGLGETYYNLSGNFLPPSEAMPRARAAAQRAIELDPQLAYGHAILGYIHSFWEWKWTEAEQSCRRAIQISPSDAAARMAYGAVLTGLGRFQESEEQFARAREIDPLSGMVAMMSLWPLFEGRQFGRAVEAASKIVQADPTSVGPRLILGQALLFRGDRTLAIAEMRRAVALDTTMAFPLGWLAYAYAVSGQRTKAQEILPRLEAWSRRAFVQPYLFVLVHVGLGNRREALDWLEKAAELHADELFFLKVDPAMDPLRSEPRFQAILKRMGLAA